MGGLIQRIKDGMLEIDMSLTRVETALNQQRIEADQEIAALREKLAKAEEEIDTLKTAFGSVYDKAVSDGDLYIAQLTEARRLLGEAIGVIKSFPQVTQAQVLQWCAAEAWLTNTPAIVSAEKHKCERCEEAKKTMDALRVRMAAARQNLSHEGRSPEDNTMLLLAENPPSEPEKEKKA